ncbi:hypothetical protein Unana1_05005 [Umbelopsis nana]
MSQSELPADFIILSDLEQAVDRDYLPPLPAEAALNVQAPGLARYIHSRDLSLNTEKRDFPQGLIHPDSPPQTFWSVLRISIRRSFAVPVQTMREMLDDWSEDSYYPDEYPTTPEERFTEDIRVPSLYPQAYHAGKVLVFATTFPNDVDSNVVDDYERLFIELFGVVHRWMGGSSEIPPNHEIVAGLRARLQETQQWMDGNASIMHLMTDSYLEKLLTECTPHIYQGTVLTAIVGNDVTLEDFLLQRDYMDRLANIGTKSRAAEKFTEAVRGLIQSEGHSVS